MLTVQADQNPSQGFTIFLIEGVDMKLGAVVVLSLLVMMTSSTEGVKVSMCQLKAALLRVTPRFWNRIRITRGKVQYVEPEGKKNRELQTGIKTNKS